MTAARTIAAFAANIRFDDLPAEVCAAAKLHLLDTLGCGVAASAAGVGGEARAVMSEGAMGGGSASVIGGTSLPAAAAALANGTLCHALDFDDTHAGAITHVSTVVCPAALAVAEEGGVSGSELAASLVAGSEVTIRIGQAARAGYMVTGFHPTSVCGVFGAAAAAGRVLNLGVEGITNALGIAGSMASGIFEYLADGSATKPLHAGWAAHCGVLAAQLAAHGATGPATVFEGRFGVFHAYHRTGGEELNERLADLGTLWETPRISFKPYPACHFIHSPLDAIGMALAGREIVPDDIERIVVELPVAGIPLVCEPIAAKVAPRTAYDAKFSVQYALAARLLHGDVSVETFTAQAIEEPKVLELARRVICRAGDFASYPGALPGRVAIHLRDGTTLEGEVLYERGSAANPMSDGQILEKFQRNTEQSLGSRASAALADSILGLEEIHSMTRALRLGLATL